MTRPEQAIREAERSLDAVRGTMPWRLVAEFEAVIAALRSLAEGRER